MYEETRDNLLADRKSNNELRGTLSKGSTTQYTDKNGNLVVRTNNSAIRNIESTAKENERLAAKLDVVNDSIFALETQILEAKVNSEAASELGPLKYLSELTGIEMNRIINWLLLIIIFVFDPLAIALVIAANFAFNQLYPKKEYLLEEQVKDMRSVVETYDNLQDEIKEWDSTLMDGLEEEPEIEIKMSGEPSLDILNEEIQGVPVMVDPKTGKLFYQTEDTPEQDWKIIDEEKQIKEEIERNITLNSPYTPKKKQSEDPNNDMIRYF